MNEKSFLIIKDYMEKITVLEKRIAELETELDWCKHAGRVMTELHDEKCKRIAELEASYAEWEQGFIAKECEWEYQNDEGYYETKCGKSFYFSDDGMFLSEEEQGKLQDGFKWCPYCGKYIKVIYVHEDNE